MEVSIIGSNSSGNCYIFKSTEGEILLVECGVKWKEIQKGVNFKMSKISGCILTHCHGDHSKSAKDVLNAGIPVYSSKGTLNEICLLDHHNSRIIKSGHQFKVGSYIVKAFDIEHDVPEPLGFLIWHKEMGLTLFLTDTYYTKYRFEGLNHIMVEANYLPENLENSIGFLRNRTMTSHMSIDTCIDMLKETDLSNVKNIVLIHLSDRNSDETGFIDTVRDLTGKDVFVAKKGLNLDFNQNIF